MLSKDEANATWIPASRMNFTPAPPKFSSGSTWPITCHEKVNTEVKSGLVGYSSVLHTSLHALRDHQLVAGPGAPLRSDVSCLLFTSAPSAKDGQDSGLPGPR